MKCKKILINSDKDYKKLLKKINIYKSILYFNTNFVVENNINEPMIDYIINALNIKKRRKRIEYIYDKSCELIDNKNKGINICGFKDNKCYIQQKQKSEKCNGCCRMCLYQSEKGCTTKNLQCKLFNCTEVKSRYETIAYEDLKILKLLSLKNKIVIKSEYFSKREDVLKDLYAYTFIYSSLRLIVRLIVNYIRFEVKKRKNKLLTKNS